MKAQLILLSAQPRFMALVFDVAWRAYKSTSAAVPVPVQCAVHTDHAVICYTLQCTVHMNIYIAFVFDVAWRTYVHLRQQQCIVQTR